MKKIIFPLCLLLSFSLLACRKGGSTPHEQEGFVTTSAQAKEIVQNSNEPNTNKTSFDYTAPAPVNGELKGVVELGATGFNSFIVEIDKSGRWRMVKPSYGVSAIKDNHTSPDEVKQQLKDYIATLLDAGVKGKDIHFVVSSGAAKEPISIKITAALKQLGYKVNIVTPEQEGQYAFAATMPKELEGEAFVVDLGSGNTKVSYVQDGKIVGKETYGSKYFKENVDDATAVVGVKRALSDLPGSRSKTCFLIGGIPYQMAKLQRNGKERYTTLSLDMNTYSKLAEEKGPQAACGLNIFEAVVRNANVQQVVFDWDANFTIGFLISLKK